MRGLILWFSGFQTALQVSLCPHSTTHSENHRHTFLVWFIEKNKLEFYSKKSLERDF